MTGLDFIYPEYELVRDSAKCITCRVCERQCANEVTRYDAEADAMISDSTKCVNCHRCASLCPTHAIKIVKSDDTFRFNANWSAANITAVYRQAGTGGVLLSSMGNPEPFPIYWDKMWAGNMVSQPIFDLYKQAPYCTLSASTDKNWIRP